MYTYEYMLSLATYGRSTRPYTTPHQATPHGRIVWRRDGE